MVIWELNELISFRNGPGSFSHCSFGNPMFIATPQKFGHASRPLIWINRSGPIRAGLFI